MAPGADLVLLQVLDDSGSGTFGDVEDALQWVNDNYQTYNIVAVNMSLGDGSNYNAPRSLYGLDDEIETLTNNRVLVVSAAGNSYFDFNGQRGVAYPAADDFSFAVGATYDANVGRVDYVSGATDFTTDVDRVASFSQRSTTMLHTMAPGAALSSAVASTVELQNMAGTSQAAPHVAGVAVLAQQMAIENSGLRLSFEAFDAYLQDTGDNVYDGDDENDNVLNTNANYDRLNANELLNAVFDDT